MLAASQEYTSRQLIMSHPAQALAACGDVAALRELKEMGGWGRLNPDPLVVAARCGHVEAVSFLLDFSTLGALFSAVGELGRLSAGRPLMPKHAAVAQTLQARVAQMLKK